jgi:ParB family chromosome partitioning protein
MLDINNIQNLKTEKLAAFKKHPFKIYEESTRFNDMVESIKAHGIMTPIIVRTMENGEYEILSGHNRVKAACKAGLTYIPAVVHINLNDEDAMFIVTETNLIQRSFADLSHSERAIAIHTHYEAILKNKCYRADLLLKEDRPNDMIEGNHDSPMANKQNRKPSSMEKLGDRYGLSKDTIARYLRVYKCVAAIQELLDNEDRAMPLRVVVSLSYLTKNEQKLVVEVFKVRGKLSIGEGRLLREKSEILKKDGGSADLDKKTILDILSPKLNAPLKPIKLGNDFLADFFTKGESPEEIKSIMADALTQYFTFTKMP